MRDRRLLVIAVSAMVTLLVALIFMRVTGVIHPRDDAGAPEEESLMVSPSDSRTTGGGNGQLGHGGWGSTLSGETTPSGAGGGGSPGGVAAYRPLTGPPPLPMEDDSGRQSSSKAEIEQMLKDIAGFRQRVNEESMAWGLQRINDTSLQADTREVYRLRLIMPLHQGHQAFEEKDYVKALGEYQKALEDPLATPVTRYLTYEYMIEAARQLKDIDRYIEYLKAQSALIEDEDLGALGLKKMPGMKELAEERGKLLRAAKDPVLFDQIVAERMRRDQTSSAKSREFTARSVREDIESVEKAFYHDPDF